MLSLFYIYLDRLEAFLHCSFTFSRFVVYIAAERKRPDLVAEIVLKKTKNPPKNLRVGVYLAGLWEPLCYGEGLEGEEGQQAPHGHLPHHGYDPPGPLKGGLATYQGQATSGFCCPVRKKSPPRHSLAEEGGGGGRGQSRREIEGGGRGG